MSSLGPGSLPSRRRNRSSPVDETVGSQRNVDARDGAAGRLGLARERNFFAGFHFVIRTVYTTPERRVQSVPREALDADLRKNEPKRHAERNQECRDAVRQCA